MHGSPTGNLVPLDLEIKATLRRNRAERRRKLLQDKTVASILEEETHSSDSLSPDSPSSRESATQLPETASMVDNQHQKITLEDYSSSSVPQFFTSIARPEVQVHNINYPHRIFMYRNLIHYLKRIVQPVIVWSQRSIAYFKNKSGLNENLSKLFLIGDGTGLVGLMWRRTENTGHINLLYL